MAGKLTDKQVRVCQEYVIDLNATQSAIRAGYSEKTAGQIGDQNLKKLEIQEYIQELQEETSEKLNIKKEDVLILTWDIAKNSLSRDTDRLKAAEIVNKMLGFYEEDNNQKRSITTVNLKDAIKFTNGDKSK